MLRSELCCARSIVGAVGKGPSLPAQHISGRLELSTSASGGAWWETRPGFAIRRPNAIEHISPEFRAGFEVHVRRAERLVAELQRDRRERQTGRNMLRSRPAIGIAALPT